MAADILVVDDEVDIRELVAGLLEDEGYDTRMASHSDEALELIEQRRPSLIFLDIWLQGSRLDGLALLAVIKQKHPELPVVMISGHGGVETAVAAIKRGAYDFIEKPFKADRLILVAERALEASSLKRKVKDLQSRSGAETKLVWLLQPHEQSAPDDTAHWPDQQPRFAFRPVRVGTRSWWLVVFTSSRHAPKRRL